MDSCGPGASAGAAASVVTGNGWAPVVVSHICFSFLDQAADTAATISATVVAAAPLEHHVPAAPASSAAAITARTPAPVPWRASRTINTIIPAVAPAATSQ